LIKEAKSTPVARILPTHQERGSVIAKKNLVSAEAQAAVARTVPETPRVAPPSQKTQTPEGWVLVTTTEQIEGRKIDTYFGLINANAVMEIDNELSGPIGDDPPSTAMLYRRHFNNATLVVLRDLRHSAAGLGANAVIAVSFSFQKLDGGLLPTILLSAVGTAVHIT
jgi:uncharacterized protein YbjQ (UPF0145 family)